MRFFSFSVVGFLFLWPCAGPSWADRVAQAPVTAVTVYPDRAVVTRAATVELSAGLNTVTLPGLPRGLVDDSVQVSAQSAGGLTLLDARVAERHGEAADPERLKPLLEKQEALQEKIDQARIELDLLRQQQGFLAKVEEGVTKGSSDGELPAPEHWRGMMAFFRDSLGELLPSIHEVETRMKKLSEEHAAVKLEIEQTRRGGASRTKEAVIRLEAGAAMEEARLTLVYMVMNAGWSPVYNVRVNSADKGIRLDYEAAIRQRTGEDWENVRLTLSTARPALGGNPPGLGAWIVDVARPPPEPARERSVAPLMRSIAPASAEMVADAGFADAAVEEGLTAVNLRVPVKVSVPADGQPHRMGIATVAMEGDFFYAIVPKLSPHAFLQARVTHAGEAPILPGRATVFLDGNMTGHSHLPRVEPEGNFDLSLGVDEAILVERKLLRRFVDQRGILSRTTRTRFEFLTTVTNRRSTEERFVIRDHVPVSRNERIKVNLEEISGGVADGENPGHYKWEKTLSPGAKLEIPLVFTVEHPDDMSISGLGEVEGRE